MAKGAGMIHPNMATMLAVIVTDAAVAPARWTTCCDRAVDASFNCISVDGDTSTNDTVLVLANGAAGPVDAARISPPRWPSCAPTWRSRSSATARAPPSSSRSASRARRRDADARRAAKAVANSPLVKTAFYGGDANWGRILAPSATPAQTSTRRSAGLWIAAGRGEASPMQRTETLPRQAAAGDGWQDAPLHGRRAAAGLFRGRCRRNLRRQGNHRDRRPGAGHRTGDGLDVRSQP